ncbi:hypothetical protein [Thalassolituus oleivorans]|uniref:hypothetical protein n=1 Tax=Thalassolituus oleivorans TaxID=187493 RepID=UPI00240A2A61|nr:hypothetical protein [Thalassolituus oleivorans]MDF1639514.1 hypothetical protein [Thalassolituus oleivorans]
MLLLRSLLLTLFVSLPAYADNSELERSVFQLSVDVKMLLLKYYHVQADEGNTQRIAELSQRRSEVEALHEHISKQLDGSYLPYKQNIQQRWMTFDSYLKQNLNEIKESNYPELQVVTLMREAQRAMLDELEKLGDNLRQNSETKPSEYEQWSRNQKNLMISVVERYIERAASSMGAPLTTDQIDIAALCKQFDRGLADMKSQATSDEAQALLSKIRSQWIFIQTAATNTDAKLVPFLVMRYTDNILDRLTLLDQHS